MTVEDGVNTFWWTYIYGNLVLKYRQKQWSRLIASEYAGFLKHKPRMIIGDFNDIKRSEKSKGAYQGL